MSKRALALRMTAVAALAMGGLAFAPTAANASIVACPSMHYSYNIYGTSATATCYDSHGNIYYSNPGNLFRVKITCYRLGHADQTEYGAYSNWRSTATCNANYEIKGTASVQYSTAT